MAPSMLVPAEQRNGFHTTEFVMRFGASVKDKSLSPPVVGSVKMNFLASLMLSGVTGTRRFGCQTLILLEKLMKLKRSPGRRSLKMVNRASLVWRKIIRVSSFVPTG